MGAEKEKKNRFMTCNYTASTSSSFLKGEKGAVHVVTVRKKKWRARIGSEVEAMGGVQTSIIRLYCTSSSLPPADCAGNDFFLLYGTVLGSRRLAHQHHFPSTNTCATPAPISATAAASTAPSFQHRQ